MTRMHKLVEIEQIRLFAPRRSVTFAVGGPYEPYHKAVQIIFMKTGLCASFRYFGDEPDLLGCLTAGLDDT